MSRYLALGVVVMGLLGIHRVTAHDARKQSLPSRPERPVAAVRTGDDESVALAAAYSQAAQQTLDFYEGLRREAWIHAETERLAQEAAAAEAARLAEARRAPGPPAPGGGAVGDCTGFAVPDYIIQRESGGNPNAYNASSGAYGCSQTLLSHYNGGGVCAGLDPYTIEGQRDCTQRLYDRGGLSPWSTR